MGPALDRFDKHADQQAGDPRRAAAVIIAAVEADHQPLHLVLGADTVRRSRSRVERFTADLDQWEERAAATALAADG